LIGLLLFEAAIGLLAMAGCVLFAEAFFEGRNFVAAMNLGFVFVGLGNLATPALVGLFLTRLGIQRGLGIAGLVFLLPGLLASFGVSFTPSGLANATTAGDVWGSPVFWLAALFFALYWPLEGILVNKGRPYLAEMSLPPRKIALVTHAFGGLFILSRLVAAYVFHSRLLSTGLGPWWLLGLLLVAAVALGNMAGTHQRTQATVCYWLSGLVLGPVLPTLLASVFDYFPSSVHGTAAGGVFALGCAGSLAVPPVFSAIAKGRSLRGAMRAPTVLALLAAGTALVWALIAG
jgi:hypothetical protein